MSGPQLVRMDGLQHKHTQACELHTCMHEDRHEILVSDRGVTRATSQNGWITDTNTHSCAHANFGLTYKLTDRPIRLHTETLLPDVLRYVAVRAQIGPLRGWRQSPAAARPAIPGAGMSEVWVCQGPEKRGPCGHTDRQRPTRRHVCMYIYIYTSKRAMRP